MLALPSAADPQVTIFRRADGSWFAELGAELRAVADRDALDVGGARWWLFLPGELGAVPATQKADGSPLAIEEIGLHFAPSLDEEHVDVSADTDDGKQLVLPPRSSHYMLLTLARARLQDAGSGIPLDEQGWLYAAELADMLQYTTERLNLEIFRARALLAKLGVADSTQLIERRPGTRQLRIGVARLSVTRG
jgi:hypothetical protein